MKNRMLIYQLICLLGSGLLVFIFVVWLLPSKNRAEKLVFHEEQVINLDEEGIKILVERASQASFVLLGEASHGTSEYYVWRREITKELIENYGFSYLLVEGDWASLSRVNRYVKLLDDEFDSAHAVLKTFERWPRWIWANQEFLELVEWLRSFNEKLPLEHRVGVYGKDIYGIEDSAAEVFTSLDRLGSDFVREARENYDCFLKYEGDYGAYVGAALAAAGGEGRPCHTQLESVLTYLKQNQAHYQQQATNLEWLNLKQNALVVINGEKYFRLSLEPSSAAWNSRVMHMKTTQNNLEKFYQAQLENAAKGIIWAHNTHVGDARATEMAGDGSINIGQLMREKHGLEKIFIVGFSTYQGEVMAGSEWGSEAQVMRVPTAQEGSLEDLLQTYRQQPFTLFLDKAVPDKLTQTIGHRAKGVVFNPSQDRRQYVATIVPERYDAFIFINNTTALTKLKSH